MNILECLLYGFVSGLTEFLPISANAHQAFLLKLFGYSQINPSQNFFIHAAILCALFLTNKTMLQRIRRESRLNGRNGARKYQQAGYRSTMDMRIVKTSAVPMVIGLLFTASVQSMQFNLPVLSLFLVVNGIILFIPQHMLQGNKNASIMSRFDALLLGMAGALSVFPGISRIGVLTSTASIRGADRQCAFNWAILLSIPALIVLCLFDLIALFGTVAAFTVGFFGYVFSILGAATGVSVAILLIRFMSVKVGFSGFAFYSWGAALFSFILYLLVV